MTTNAKDDDVEGRSGHRAQPDNSGGGVGLAEKAGEPAQQFGQKPLEVRDTDHYTDEYVTPFVKKWDDLIDWKRRASSEGSFFIDQLKARGVRKVLDVATGTGFHSVQLLEEGFETVSADGSAQMLAQAFENGQRHGGHILRVVQADWRWLNRDVHGEYDAIVCLGNSFTHLFDERDRRKALAEFYAMLKHDGVLIIDQRNYDALLDDRYSNRHTYYYCGEEVTAEPEHVDEGLARFVYRFADNSEYHLNMYPLRKNYMRRLMREVGFQRIDTYGDFQASFTEDEPDFFIHIAEKAYHRDERPSDNYSTAVGTARSYYNSTDADNFYATIWGGEDIHVGLYESDDEDIATASARTVATMADKLQLSGNERVLDVGAGFGGAARHLARRHGVRVSCLNLSEVENDRNRQLTYSQNLGHLVEVVDGSFEDLPFEDNSFDVVWSQDAMLHSGDRVQVLSEVARVLRPGGQIIFTDPMAVDGFNREALVPILARLQLDSMATPGEYHRELTRLGMSSIDFDDRSPQLPIHYRRVLEETERHAAELDSAVSSEYQERMKAGLRHWVEAGQAGNLSWGIFHAKG